MDELGEAANAFLESPSAQDLGDFLLDFLDALDRITDEVKGFVADPIGGTGGAKGLFEFDPSTPFALDLDGDGLEYVARAGSGVFFDIDGDRFAEHVEWLKGDDGFLVRDSNANGQIDSVGEMFGDQGGTTAYQKLQALDSNASNSLTAADAGWSTLRVWKDSNEDGNVDSGELKNLAELGITSIGTVSSGATTLNGHAVAGTSSFAINGATRTAADVLLETDQNNSWYVGDGTEASTRVDLDALSLPLSRGYGTMPSLHYAMTGDAILKSMIADFATLNPAGMTTLYDRLDEILIRWAGAENIGPASRGAHVDARHLVVLESVMGSQYHSPHTGTHNPGAQEISRVGEGYALFAEQILERLLVQGPLRAVFPNAAYNFTGDRLELDDTLGALIARAAANQPAPGTASHKVYWNEIGRILSHYHGDLGATAIAAKTAVDNAAGFVTLPVTTPGTAGDDILGGIYGNDVFRAGAGNDRMYGGEGNDVYIFGAESGNDFVYDNIGNLALGPHHDAIRFETLNPANVILSKAGSDLIVRAPSIGETITVYDHFYLHFTGGRRDWFSIDEFQFADGQIWNMATIDGIAEGTMAAPAPLRGTAGSDVLTADYETLNMVGGAGADRFVIAPSSGRFLTIADFNAAQGDRIDLSAFDNVTAFYQLGLFDLVGHATFDLPGPDGVIRLNISNVGSGQLSLANILSNTLPYGAGSTVAGGAAADVLAGTGGDDTLYGLEGGDTLSGGTGRDTLWGWTGNDTINGGYGDDFIGGDQDNDLLGGDGGNDTIYGDVGADTLNGGDGADILAGGVGADIIDGGAGMDVAGYAASAAAVTVNLASNVNSGGEAAGDVLANVENLLGGASADLLGGDFAANILSGGDGNDTLSAGGGGDDSLRGNGGDDILIGGDGNDWLEGDSGADMMDGGNGIDAVSYGASGFAVTVNLATGISTGGDAQGDVIRQVEWIHASRHHDTLTGNGGDNAFRGGNGDDVIGGGGGADLLHGDFGSDILTGGAGDDWLDGGAGDDLLVFAAGQGMDVIDGFEGEGAAWGDVIRLAGIPGVGSFAAVQAATSYDFAARQAVINLGGGNLIIVNGIDQAFAASDFSFL